VIEDEGASDGFTMILVGHGLDIGPLKSNEITIRELKKVVLNSGLPNSATNLMPSKSSQSQMVGSIFPVVMAR
jgi:hypothetical protein